VVNVITRPVAAGTWSAQAAAGSFLTFSAAADAATGGPRWGLLGALALDATGGRFPYLFDPHPSLPGSALEPREREHDGAALGGLLVKGWGLAGGGVDLSSIPRAWISRIEVVRGPEGAHFGSGALGGVVNVITRPVAAGTWSAQAAAGSFLTFSAAADAATGGARWGLLGALALDATGGRFPYLFDPHPSLPGSALEPREREHDGAALGGLLAKGWGLVGGGRLDALAQVSGGWRELPGWPYSPTPDDWQRDGRAAAVVRYGVSAGPGLSLSSEVSTRLDRLDARLQSLGGATTRQHGLAGQIRLGADWQHGPGTLTASVSAGGERLAADGLGESRSRAELALALGEELLLGGGRLRLAPALRLERIGATAGVSGKLGSTLRIAGPLSARAGAAATFRAPSFSELYLQQGLIEPNPDLAAERAVGGDAALMAEGDLGLVSAGAFATLYRDLIVYEPGSLRRLKPFNDGKALVRGIEAEAASAPLPALLGLSGAVAYTFLDSQTLRGEEAVLGKDLPHRPRHRLYARASVEGERGGAHLEAHWVGAQWQDSRNIQPIPAALTLNAGGFVVAARRPVVRLSVEVRNLLDDRRLQDGFGTPLPSRTVLLTVRVESPTGG